MGKAYSPRSCATQNNSYDGGPAADHKWKHTCGKVPAAGRVLSQNSLPSRNERIEDRHRGCVRVVSCPRSCLCGGPSLVERLDEADYGTAMRYEVL